MHAPVTAIAPPAAVHAQQLPIPHANNADAANMPVHLPPPASLPGPTSSQFTNGHVGGQQAADGNAYAYGETEKQLEKNTAGLPATIHGTHSGHRSVLGSGITSTAVQEAQMQARMKAEVYANSRKRKRADPAPEVEKPGEPVIGEDMKLTPDERKKKRYERRLALNRESAAVSRVRRREYVKLLEEQLVSAEKERVRLATELSDMQRQHNKLREHLQKLEGSIDDGDN